MKAQEQKEIRQLEKERRRLQMATWNAPELPLEKPYQRGWVRWFEWTPEARRRKDFAVLDGVMELIQVKEWSIRRDFRPPRKRGVRDARSWHRHLRFSAKELLSRCRDPRLLQYFETWRRRPVNESDYLRFLVREGWGGVIRFRYPQLIASRIEPNMITHQRVVLPEIEARLSEIQRWIDSRGGWEWMDGQLGVRKWKPLPSHERIRKREWLMDRDIRLELEAMKGAEKSAPFSWGALRAVIPAKVGSPVMVGGVAGGVGWRYFADMTLEISTPALLFPAISLLFLAFTNRFLHLAALIRQLYRDWLERKDDRVLAQIANLRCRLALIRWMQFLGAVSLFLCVISMVAVMGGWQKVAVGGFWSALVVMAVSLASLMYEVWISGGALRIMLRELEDRK